MTIKEYKEKYPDFDILPESIHTRLVEANKEKWNRPGYKNRVSKSISDTITIQWRDGKYSRYQSEDHVMKRVASTRSTKQKNPEKYWGKNSSNYNSKIDQFIADNQGKHKCQCGCGGVIEIKRYHYNSGIPKFLYNHHSKGENNPNYGKHWTASDEYKKRRSEASIGPNNPMYGRSHTDDTKRKISEKAKKRFENLEARILISCRRLGIDRDEWVDFASGNDRYYYSKKYRDWRNSVFQRDNYTCQICNVIGGKLNAHHIYKVSMYPELIFEINNGITLCYNCHFHKVNQHEEEYKIELLSKIFDNKGREIFGGEC